MKADLKRVPEICSDSLSVCVCICIQIKNQDAMFLALSWCRTPRQTFVSSTSDYLPLTATWSYYHMAGCISGEWPAGVCHHHVHLCITSVAVTFKTKQHPIPQCPNLRISQRFVMRTTKKNNGGKFNEEKHITSPLRQDQAFKYLVFVYSCSRDAKLSG